MGVCVFSGFHLSFIYLVNSMPNVGLPPMTLDQE